MQTEVAAAPGEARRALVTGASGYIGGRLVGHLLQQGWQVHVVLRPHTPLHTLQAVQHRITVHRHDGSTAGMGELMAQALPHTVFHLASLFLAQHRHEDVPALITSNLLFGTQLAEAMVQHGVRELVNTGTAWQHFESAPYNPVNLYAATKQAFEDLLAYYVQAHGLKVCTLALFDTYGPDDPRAKLIALLWKTALAGVPLPMSPGEQLIDLVHIDDVLAAYTQAAALLPQQAPGHARYGVSSGQPLRLQDLVRAFEAATGCPVPIVWGGRPYRVREVMQPWHNPPRLPGWQPRVPFATGVLQTRPAMHG